MAADKKTNKFQLKNHIDVDPDNDLTKDLSELRINEVEKKKYNKNKHSRLPVYKGNDNRYRRYSDGQKNHKSSYQQDHLHYNDFLASESLSSSTTSNLHHHHHYHQIMPPIMRVQHSLHDCLYSKSLPTSANISHHHTPSSTPSTPIDKRNRGSSSSINQSKSTQNSPHISKPHKCRTSNRSKFEEYLPLCQLQQGLNKGEIVEGILRINPKNFEDAYISAPDGGVDIYIGGIHDRNRALNGDKVAVKLNDPKEWKLMPDNVTVQKTATVVGIIEKNHQRIAGGYLRLMKDKNPNWALFAPKDSRIPRMMVPMTQCPTDFFHHSEHYSQSLFIAKLEKWDSENKNPLGTLESLIGNEGDIQAETEIILVENGINFTEDFPPEAFDGLPLNNDDLDQCCWTIPECELQYRRNFTSDCVFTIDPSTARDLDDALSIRELDHGNFQIGVHIADVSYFVKEGINLDKIARDRCNSVYLVHKVIPMLPRILCEKLCSLNPGQDKLTFSVVWIVNSEAEIIEEWFGRSIINSCIKLSYEIAQDMIDDPNKEWTSQELPQIYGQWTPSDISQCVNKLNYIGTKLRNKRFERGALRIDKLKLHFTLDKQTGMPTGFSSYSYRESNKLVEEFMLLANMAVAHRIYKLYAKSGKAFLRSHTAPDEKLFKEFKQFCDVNKFEIDITSSKTLQSSLNRIVGNNSDISKVVAHFLLKSMNMATYVVSGMKHSPSSFHHYALNVPLYTHFTSPIRRYPDIIVHRLLASSLNYDKMIKDSVLTLHKIATKCNERKHNARIISESSAKIFLFSYIKQINTLQDKSVVVSVYDHSFDVMLLQSGLICRVYMNNLPVDFKYETHQGLAQLILHWKNHNSTQIIRACQVLNVMVSVNKQDPNKLNVLLQNPNGEWHENETT